MTFGLLFGNPLQDLTKKWTAPLLQISVVGLGAGMNLITVGQVGLQGIGFTITGIALTMVLGIFLGRLFKTEASTSILVTSGTAICGGSAIAAVSSAIRAGAAETSVALAVVFLLNAVALFVFPWAGHLIGLDERQFGLWSALAIHDTSSVVGAGLLYGPHALEVATTVKLARALWIVPLTFLISTVWNRGNLGTKVSAKKPWFILGFVLIAALVTWIPELQQAGGWVATAAKRSLVLTLFLIGSGLTQSTLKRVGKKPFLQGILLWILVATASLEAILLGWVK